MVSTSLPNQPTEPIVKENFSVRRAKAGNAQEFSKLFDSFFDAVYRYVYFLTMDDIAAEKVTSRVFILAWQRFDQYSRHQLFLVWLYGIAREQAGEYYKTHSKPITPKFNIVLPTTSDDSDLVTNSRALNQGIRNIMSMQTVRGALQFLSEEQQQVLLLKFMDRMSLSQLAHLLSKRESAIPDLLILALQNLHQQMEKVEAEAVPWEILSDCLDRLEENPTHLEECLAAHPEHAPLIRPLLQTAQNVSLGHAVTAPVEYRARTREYLVQYIHFNPRVQPVYNKALTARLAVAMLTLMLGVFITGTVHAQSVLPGDNFYTWKRTSEMIWRAVSPNPVSVDIAIANRRAMEWIALAHNPKLSANAKGEYLAALDHVLVVQSQNPQASVLIVPALQTQISMLEQAGMPTPEVHHYLDVALAAAPVAVATPTKTAVPTHVVVTATRTRPMPTATSVPPTHIPSATPTNVPTFTSTPVPTFTPTDVPTSTPTDEPTATPTEIPPTPTREPTSTPTEEPPTPTEVPPTPTDIPSTPTDVPNVEPTAWPTDLPPLNIPDP